MAAVNRVGVGKAYKPPQSTVDALPFAEAITRAQAEVAQQAEQIRVAAQEASQRLPAPARRRPGEAGFVGPVAPPPQSPPAAAPAPVAAPRDPVALLEQGVSPEVIARQTGQTVASVEDQLADAGLTIVSRRETGESRQTVFRRPDPPGNITVGSTSVALSGSNPHPLLDPLPGGATLVLNEDFHSGDSYVEHENPRGVGQPPVPDVPTPIRDGLGRAKTSSRDPGDGSLGTRIVDDLGLSNRQTTETVSHRDGYRTETVSGADGATLSETVTTRGGVEITMAGQPVDAERLKQTVFTGPERLSVIAEQEGLSMADLEELLRDAGVEIEHAEPSSANGDVASTTLVDPASNIRIVEGYDYQHGEPTRTVLAPREVEMVDPQSGQTATVMDGGAAGYAAQHQQMSDAIIADYDARIAELDRQIGDGTGDTAALLEQRRVLEMGITGWMLEKNQSEATLAQVGQAMAEQLAGEAYGELQNQTPGMDAYDEARTVFLDVLDYVDVSHLTTRSADANVAAAKASQTALAAAQDYREAAAAYDAEYQVFKEGMLYGTQDAELIAQMKSQGQWGPGTWQAMSLEEVDRQLRDDYDELKGLGLAESTWAARNRASDAARSARADLAEALDASRSAALIQLRANEGYLQGMQTRWLGENPGQDPAASPFAAPINELRTNLATVEGAPRPTEAMEYQNDRFVLSLPAEIRHDPAKLDAAQVDFVRDHPNFFSADAAQLQASLAPITGGNADEVRSIVEPLAGEMMSSDQVDHVVAQILQNPVIHGDNPDAADLTVTPIAMSYFEPGGLAPDGLPMAAPTGLLEVTKSDGATWYVDLDGYIYKNREDFLNDNRLYSDAGLLVMPGGLKPAAEPGGATPYEAVQANNVTAWERSDPLVGIGTTVAAAASFIPVLTPVAAPLAYAGAAYLGGRAVANEFVHIGHGGSLFDKTSLLNGLSAAATFLPVTAGVLRSASLATQTSLSTRQALMGGFGAISNRTPFVDDVTSHLRNGGWPITTAWALDAGGMVFGVPLLADSARQLPDLGEMSPTDATNTVLGVLVGGVGTALGARGLAATRPGQVKPAAPADASPPLTNEEITNLTEQQIPDLDVARLAPSQIPLLRGQVGALTRDQLGALTIHQMEAMTRAQVRGLTPSQLRELGPRFRMFSPEQFEWMSTNQTDALSVHQLNTYKATHGNLTQDQKSAIEAALGYARIRDYAQASVVLGNMSSASVAMFASLPPEIIPWVYSISYLGRGLVFGAQSLSPDATASHMSWGRFLNTVAALTFIGAAPSAAVPLVSGDNPNPIVNGTYTAGNVIYGPKALLTALTGRTDFLQNLDTHVGLPAYVVGSAVYAGQSMMTDPVAFTAGTLFAFGCAEFWASGIRTIRVNSRPVPRTDAEIMAAAKSDADWAMADRVTLGITFGGGLLLFAVDSLNGNPGEAPAPDYELDE